MFDNDLGLDPQDRETIATWQPTDALADVRRVAVERLASIEKAKRALDVEEIVATLAFCDAYRTVEDCPLPGAEQLVVFGDDGCPQIGEFAVLELAARLGRDSAAVGHQIRDAQNLAYRFPNLFTQVKDQRLEFWQATKITRECRELTLEQARQVDDALRNLEWLSTGRVLRTVRGLIARVTQTQFAATPRLKKRTLITEHDPRGFCTIYGRIAPTDGRYLELMLDRLCAIFERNGDDSPINERRAKALGLLAFPARALSLLQQSIDPDLFSEFPVDAVPADEVGPEALRSSDASGRQVLHELHHTCGQIVVDPEKLLPRATLHVHIAAGTLQQLADGEEPSSVLRVEGIGPVLATQLKEMLGETRLRVVPVIDPAGMAPFDGYEIPERMREAVTHRNPIEVFPGSARSARGCQLDHTTPYEFGPTSPPGQTAPANLGPLGQRVHRAKTHGHWHLEQDRPGEFVWESPLGHRYLVTPTGTRYLGNHSLLSFISPIEARLDIRLG